MLEGYIDRAYDDKLAGVISEELWRQKNQRWLGERESVRREIQSNDDSKQDYIENGVLLIELAQRTEHIYKTANSDVKRKLVEIISSNHVLRNGTIEFDYKKPFDVLAKTTSKETWWRTSSLPVNGVLQLPTILGPEFTAILNSYDPEQQQNSEC